MGCESLPNMVIWCFLLVRVSMVTFRVLGQPSTDGFISIDCGIPDGYTYVDDITNIPYVSDAQFIETGISYNTSPSYQYQALAKQQTTLRSFPSGARNCYNLKPVMQDNKYLITAVFMYGNYDGLYSARADDPILFDLQIGVNYWDSMTISNASATYRTEVMMIASADFISVCLINKGFGTPFISSLELRPLSKTIYKAANASRSLVHLYRNHMGTKTIRFPDDRYDRVWLPWWRPYWTDICTTSTVKNFAVDAFEAPSAVMQTAATPVNFSGLRFYWESKDEDTEYYLILHISELQSLTGNNTRQFNIYLNDDLWFGPYTPRYLLSGSIHSTTFQTGYLQYNVTLNATSNSTLSPILNAVEIYIIRPLLNVPTDVQEVDAIMAIKQEYRVKKNWMGDPCTPEEYAWDGVNCSASMIIAINLSSSGLTGVIASSFARLKAIEYLDLSYNNLTGPIPDFLADLSSLQVLNLTGNHFNGTIPDALRSKKDKGLLVLSIDDDIKLCTNENFCLSKKNKKKISAPIITIISVVGVVLLLVLMFLVWRMRQRVQGMTFGASIRPGSEDCSGQKMDWENHPLQLESRQFTYMLLVNITNNFVRVIGKGGFGMVYHGYLENGTEVAVKMRSQSSSQGAKEFLAEAENLARVHHKNLVSLVGYCRDGNCLALVYEYMSRGTLQENLRGKACQDRALSWGERLRIAINAAQGLEYLHKGCKPPLIHRDVKSGNILLSQRLEAKIADFGLSKVFHSDVQSHVSTAVVGTPGYLDPKYYNTFQLSEKSDVYSFGVVLLELITGQPPIISVPENCTIIHWVCQRLAKGNIEDAIDARMKGEYDVNSVWKAADVALNCTKQASIQRPSMADVVMQLKEGLALEAAQERSMNSNLFTCSANNYSESSDVNWNSIFEMEHVGKISVVSGPAVR